MVSLKQKITHTDFEFEVDSLIPKSGMSDHPRFSRFLNLARHMSEASNFNRYRIGAVLVSRGRVIARGYNSSKTHPTQKMYNFQRTDLSDGAPHFIHAEIDVLNKVKDIDLKNAQLFIFHINNQGQQKMARPCAACMKAIKDRGIEVIHYSTPDGLASEYISKDQKIMVNKSRSPI